MRQLDGKVAVVTGAGSGIGRALGVRLAREGMRLALADIDGVALTESAALVAGESSTEHVTTHCCDISDGGAVGAFADAVFGRWERVDVLCNNAGVFVGGTIWERPVEDFEFAFGANLWGILHGLRSFVPRMIAQDSEGHVVNTASVAGLFGAPFEAPYAISKFAAFAATESLANDFVATGSKLRASVLCPGIIKTNIVSSDRNRPVRLATEVTEDQKFVTAFLEDAVSRGLDPARVADAVVDAIRSERFLVLTHDSYAAQLTSRAEALAERRLPDVAAFD